MVMNQEDMEAGVGIEPAYVELQSNTCRSAFRLLFSCLTAFGAAHKRALSDHHAPYKTITYAGVCALFGPQSPVIIESVDRSRC